MTRASRLFGLAVLPALAFAAASTGCSSKAHKGSGGDTSTATNGGPSGSTSGGLSSGNGGGIGTTSSSSGGPSCDPGSVNLDGCACNPSTDTSKQCFVGDPSKAGKGACVWGMQQCMKVNQNEFMSGTWGPCVGSGMPSPEVCDGKNDEDCDGMIDNGCMCTNGQTQMCVTAQGNGSQVCQNNTWGPCMLPSCGPNVVAGQPCAQPGQEVMTPPNTCGCGDLGSPTNTLYCDNNLTWQCFPMPPPMLCTQGQVNNEPEMIVGYEPQNGMTVSQNGQVKVWVNDECPAFISPNEVLDPGSGAITTPGDHNAKAPDGYLWEPALYIAPDTAENGGTPHFPDYIKGDYNNNPGSICGFLGGAGNIPGADPPPPNAMISEQFTSEYIWNVKSLGLGPGTYIGEFVVHDGDVDRGVGCITIIVK